MILLALFACEQNPTTSDNQVVNQGEPPQDTAYLAELEDKVVPDLQIAEAFLQEAIIELRNVRVNQVLDTYFALMELTDSNCPRWYSDVYGLYWADTCQAESNLQLQGVGTLNRYVDGTIDESGNTWFGRQIYCEGVLENQDEQLLCTGNATQLQGLSPTGDDIFYSYSEAHTIVSGGEELQFPKMENYASRSEDAKAIYYSAVLPIDSGFVQFDTQILTSYGCTMEPSGSQHIQVTDTGDSWLYVVWHGAFENLDMEQCDGCGDVYFQGEAVGSICADFSTWLDWTTSPFE
jgi:hypothetical protein